MLDTNRLLPDATVNLLVELPGTEAIEPPMDATITVPTANEEGEPKDATSTTRVTDDVRAPITPSQTKLYAQNLGTSVPCSIVLKDVSVKLKGKTSVVIPPTEEIMSKAKVCLQRIDSASSVLP